MANQVLAEGMMMFLLGQLKPGSLVDAPRRDQHVVGPQSQCLVSLHPREIDALLHEMLAYTQASGRRLNVEEAQLCQVSRCTHQKYGANDPTGSLRHPAAFHI